ncbi:MAG TPA: hypothetical protein VH796_16465 [Nitrososphaeraceae archaeon]
MNRQETEDLVIELYYKQQKTFREIQKIVRKSPRDIKFILNKVEPERSSLSIPAQAYRLFSEGKTPIEVAIILNIREPEATQFNLEYWKLIRLDSLYRIYRENNGSISTLVELHRRMKAEGLTVEHVIKLLLTAKSELQSIERVCQDLKREAADTTAKNFNAAGIFQRLSNDISEESKVLDHYRESCKKERLELDKLHLKKIRLGSLVRQFQDNNKTLQRIKEFVRQIVEQSLVNRRSVLTLAFLSVINACRRDPVKFNIIYHNLSTSAIREMRQPDQNDYGLSTNEQLCNQRENTHDITYLRLLLEVAEEFLDERVIDLEQVCIDQLTDTLASSSMPSKLTKNPDIDSEIATSVQLYESKNV